MTTPGLPDADTPAEGLPRLPDDIPALRVGVPDRRILEASSALETLTGWPASELVGRPANVLWPQADRDEMNRHFDEVLLMGRHRFGVQAAAPDGSAVTWIDVDARYRYNGGQRIELVLSAADRPEAQAEPTSSSTDEDGLARRSAASRDANRSDNRSDARDGRGGSSAVSSSATTGRGPRAGVHTLGAGSAAALEGAQVGAALASPPTTPLAFVPASSTDDDRTVALVMAALGAAGVPALAVLPDGMIASATSEVERLVGTPIARLRGRQFEHLLQLTDAAADALSVARAGRMRQTVLAGLADGEGSVVVDWVPGYSAGSGIGVLATEDSDGEGAEEQRMQSRLASFVAHDVRESLAAVYSGLRTLEAELPADAPQRSILEKTLKESARANRIVDDVLAVTRPGRLTRIELDLADVLVETIDRFRLRAKSNGIRIEERLPKGIAVLADLGSLERGFGNLIENSLQAMPRRGTLTVSARLEDRGSPGARVSISDTGVGIKAEILPNIFEPFVTNKPQGTGLGLPIARRVVLDHEGQIDCESEEGRGTTFHVWLPRVE